jgi:hypothetical protein
VYKNGHPLTSPPSSFDIVVVANCVCVQLRAEACQFIGTSLKKDSKEKKKKKKSIVLLRKEIMNKFVNCNNANPTYPQEIFLLKQIS